MAGRNTEILAQLKYDDLKAEAQDMLNDIRLLEDEMDKILDSNYPDYKELDRLHNIRDNTYQNYLVLQNEIKEFVEAWSYCLTVDSPLK